MRFPRPRLRSKQNSDVFEPGQPLLSGPAPRFKRDRPPRSWKRRSLITFNIVLAVVLLTGIAGVGYAKWRFGQIDKIDLGSVLRGEDAGDEMNVLLVGSDSREDLNPGQAGKFGSSKEVGGQRSDTIMILHVDPKSKRASILSIPRDTYVTIYSEDGKSKGKEKINASYLGGPKELIKTINMNFDIPIDHYVEVNFDSFRSIVNAVGGVPVRFDSPVRDSKTGLDIRTAGCQTLSGEQALAYVRSRYYETYEGGRWHQDPRADLSRIDRQQGFIRLMLSRAIEKGARNPVTLNSLIGSSVQHVKLDSGLSLNDIAKLGKRFQSLDPNDVEMLKLEIDIARNNIVKQPQGKQTIERFLNAPSAEPKTADVPTSSIRVRVLNGSGEPGQASEAAADLQDEGFLTAGTGDAKSFGNSSSTIRYARGQKAKADVLAKYISGDKNLVEDTTLSNVDVVLVTGNSFKGILKSAQETQAKTGQQTQPALQAQSSQKSTTTTTTTSPKTTTTQKQSGPKDAAC